MELNDIRNWSAPEWRPDFGNAEIELAPLKEFALCLLTEDDRFRVELNCVEEGYMHVAVAFNDVKYAEVHVIKRRTQSLYGVFSFKNGNEQEEYFAGVEECVRAVIAAKPD